MEYQGPCRDFIPDNFCIRGEKLGEGVARDFQASSDDFMERNDAFFGDFLFD